LGFRDDVRQGVLRWIDIDDLDEINNQIPAQAMPFVSFALTASLLHRVEELMVQIWQFVFLYPALRGGPHRTATMLATQNFIQKGLVDTLGLEQLV
jgi:hypothetical protein